MRTAWMCRTYLRSEMPLTDKVPPVFSLTLMVVQDAPPDEELVYALVSAHVRNVEPILSEVTKIEFDPDAPEFD